jgi:hypothetical protein
MHNQFKVPGVSVRDELIEAFLELHPKWTRKDIEQRLLS